MSPTILIHTALFHEAKPIIEYFKLQFVQKVPYRIYQNRHILLVVTGMGREKTLSIENILESFTMQRVINIGIAGCKDMTIPIGHLLCTTHELEGIDCATLSSVDSPLSSVEKLTTTLVDMESEAFLAVTKNYLNEKNIYIFKVVSDYIETTIPKKEFVWRIIAQSLPIISEKLNLER
jgi:nucleoside phosphorylase